MPYAEKAGNSLPSPRPDLDALVSAATHLRLARRALDEQRTHHLDHLPADRQKELYDHIGEAMDDMSTLCDDCYELLFLLHNPKL
jgi:transposase